MRSSLGLAARLATAALSLTAAPACSKKPPASGAAAVEAKVQVARRWSDLHLPAGGLQKVSPRTDDHGYYADYSGSGDAALWEKVSSALRAAGYLPACNVLDGRVRGFAKGDDKLVAKIDSLAGVLALSLFDAAGKDPLLHGVCFGKYQLGPATKPPAAP